MLIATLLIHTGLLYFVLYFAISTPLSLILIPTLALLSFVAFFITLAALTVVFLTPIGFLLYLACHEIIYRRQQAQVLQMDFHAAFPNKKYD